jgi:hypothetical protein
MKKSILVTGPVLSMSGYGYQSRFALKALKSREDLFDIYIQPLPWGKTGWIWENNKFRQWIDERITRTAVLANQKQLQIDMTLQIGIPSEWQKIAPENVGYTAGIETTKVAPKWLQLGNEMDKILVVSNHAKATYEKTVATAMNQETGEKFEYRLNTPIEVVWERTDKAEIEEIEGIEFENDFNFLLLSQWSPRKNFENTIKWWVEEFVDQEVGLVVKTNIAANCLIDRDFTEKRLEALLSDYPDRRCNVYLIHGDLSDGQMRWLYTHDKMKSLINIAHGEGFGLPLYEAAREALPIVTIGWSGQMDFLHHSGKDYFQSVDYTLQPVQKESVWPGVIEADSMWAFADQGSFKMTLRKTYKKWNKAKDLALELQPLVEEKFSEEKLYESFAAEVYGDSVNVDDWLKELEENFVEQE